jgi:hypothetical protein
VLLKVISLGAINAPMFQMKGPGMIKVGRYMLTVSKPVLKAAMITALEATI